MLHGSILYDVLGGHIIITYCCICRDVDHPRKKSESTVKLFNSAKQRPRPIHFTGKRS